MRLSKTFDDFSAFVESVQDVDCTMSMQNPESHEWNIEKLSFGGLDVQFGALGSGNIVEGESWKSGYLLYLPRSKNVEYRANGRAIGDNALMALEPGSLFLLSTVEAHDWCSLFIPTEKLTSVVDSDTMLRGGERRWNITAPNPALARHFANAVDQVLYAAKQTPSFERSPAARNAERYLLEISIALLGFPPAKKSVANEGRRLSQEGIVRTCLDVLDENTSESIGVSDLASAVGVSDRTLRSVFQRYYGVTPKKYLLTRQMNRAHRALQVADPAETSVTDVLTGLGVWEFGRFAGRYHQLFGEYPSQTLNGTQH